MKRISVILVTGCLLLAAAPSFAQVNLIPNLPAGWGWPLVPRPANDATTSSVPLPTTLTGDAAQTWLNSAWRNIGSTASGTFHNHSLLDGAQIIVDRTCAALAAGATAQGINGGPFTFPAGRHTFELRVDAANAVTESNEADNNVAHQWVWAPAVVATGSRLSRAAPPVTNGGWSSIPAGQDKYNNCDGVRFTTGDDWDALYVWSDDPAVDNHLRYYTPSSGASNGFATPLGTSLRVGRGVEAVFAKGIGSAAHSYDVGVERANGSGNYYVEHARAQFLSWGDSITATFAQDEMLKIFMVLPVFPMDISVWLQTTTTDPSVAMAWIDRTQLVVGLSELTIGAATDAQGRARLDATAAEYAAHAIVVFRDPDWGTGPRSFGLKAGEAKPDLAPYVPADWYSALVPRETMVTGVAVALPDTLPVTTSGPLYYVSQRNVGGTATPVAAEIMITLDGAADDSLVTYPMSAGEIGAWYPYIHSGTVRAGRHTVAMELNHERVHTEATRTNNRYGEQYCWGPPSVASTTFPEQPMYPSGPFDGWDLIGDGNGETLWFNNAAQRLPTAPTGVWWQAYAVRPSWHATYDYDVRLHEALDGCKDGLGEYLASSMLGGPPTEYVLVNLNQTPRRPFDVSISDWSPYYVGDGDFDAEYIESTTMGTAGTLTLAPYVSPEGHEDLMQLYEWYFPVGSWILHVKNLLPGDTCGLAFHHADEVYSSRPIDAAVSPEEGDDVWLQVQVQTAGWCCVVVFRPDYWAPNAPSYQLSMYPGASPVPETPAVPVATCLVDASPNPFNPQVTIAFDLAAPARARLAVFDLHGALVRVLVDADLAVGRQSVRWDGRDDAGRALPSGAYFARFEAGDVQQVRKLMLVR